MFLSYARRGGAEHVRWLDEQLQRRGVDTWHDKRDIDVAADFTSELEIAIRACRAVVLCISQDVARPDSFVRREIVFAQLVHKPIIVARFADVIPPISVVTQTYLDFHVAPQEALAVLLRTVAHPMVVDNETGLHASPHRGYLLDLYRDVVDALEEFVLLPVVGRRGQLLDLTGAMARPARPAPGRVLSARFRPRPAPVLQATADEAFHHSRGRFAISGDAGSGKTISILALTRDLATAALTQPDAPIPVLINAATWGSGGRRETELDAWVAREVPAVQDDLDQLLRSRRAVLLVDGLDEVPTIAVPGKHEGSLRNDLLDHLAQIPLLVVTGRPHAVGSARNRLGLLDILNLHPLTDHQIDAYVHDLPAVHNVLHGDSSLRAIVRTPLMLMLLCSAVEVANLQKAVNLDPNEARDLVINNFVEDRFARESDGLNITLDQFRRALGALALNDAGGGGNRNLFYPDDVRGQLGEDVLRLALHMGVLHPTPVGTLRFLHPALRDHFAFLGALDAATDPNDDVRDSVAWALWQIPDPRAYDVLIRMLDDPYPYARGSAASALGRLADTRAIPHLHALLSDHTPVVSMYGNLISEVAQEAIRQIRIHHSREADNR